MPKAIKLLICDDHAVVRRGLRSLVGVKPEMELVGEAVDGEEAVAMAKKLKPDVIIISPLQGGDSWVCVRERGSRSGELSG